MLDRARIVISDRLVCWAEPSAEVIARQSFMGKRAARLRKQRLKGKPDYKLFKPIVKYQQNMCFYCKCDIEDNYTFDHFIPVCRGGSNEVSNIVACCRSCNSRKGKRLPTSRLMFQLSCV